MMSSIVTLDLDGWRPALAPGVQETAVHAIEDGGVLVLPRVNFSLSARERRFLSSEWSDGRAKNISLDGTQLKGARGAPGDLSLLGHPLLGHVVAYRAGHDLHARLARAIAAATDAWYLAPWSDVAAESPAS